MKRARQRPLRSIKPRNPLALDPLLSKGGRHQRKDKRGSRARLKVALGRRSSED
jgi:hypothetical protein